MVELTTLYSKNKLGDPSHYPSNYQMETLVTIMTLLLQCDIMSASASILLEQCPHGLPCIKAAVLNLLLQFSHFGHYQTIISPLSQPNIP